MDSGHNEIVWNKIDNLQNKYLEIDKLDEQDDRGL